MMSNDQDFIKVLRDDVKFWREQETHSKEITKTNRKMRIKAERRLKKYSEDKKQ